MSLDRPTRHELRRLLEALCEDRLQAADVARLEELVLADRQAMRFYLDYLDLHGSLYWDAGVNNAEDSSLTLPRLLAASGREPETAPQTAAVPESAIAGRAAPTRARRRVAATLAATIAIVAALVFVVPRDDAASPERPAEVADGADERAPVRERRVSPRSPVELGPDVAERLMQPQPDDLAGPVDEDDAVPGRSSDDSAAGGSSDETIVAFVDERIQTGYADREVGPSPRADDAEWLRRAALDLTGRIPTREAVDAFLADTAPDKRAKAVERLLDDRDFTRHFATTWTNLLVGRIPEENVDRDALAGFLREAFARNRPWSDVVHELVSAEGAVDETGSANFLVAHLNNQAVPATAITARVFLGVQVQCTQCHDHPFNDWKQNQFWELNGFFQQTDVVKRDREKTAELVSKPVGGPTYYETRRGVMRVAYPRFEGEAVDPSSETNRRRALADLMVSGDRPQFARAMVNRTWAHFFGHGFTRPIDDMGPHNPPTHPELLDRLTTEFVRSGYDVKRLVRWIANSEAYQLSSRFGEHNVEDDPEAGYAPAFSRVYVKPMSPEQVYDSLLVATRGEDADRAAVASDREEWVGQFVRSYQTDENDEQLVFEGSIPQALALMNGSLVAEGLEAEPDTELGHIVPLRTSLDRRIEQVFLAALSRRPTAKELTALREIARDATRSRPRRPAEAALLQDLFWALLNSNEFVHVH